MHLNQLANQLQQLAENVANLQETNEESKVKYQQENLLAEVGDMKGYLELLVFNVCFMLLILTMLKCCLTWAIVSTA